MQSVLPSTNVLILKAIIGLLVTGIGTLLLWPFRKARQEWIGLKKGIAETQAELITQRTNCLSTLQDQGEKQITLLGEAVGVLREIHTSQAEMSGFLKGQNSKL
jgi:hypothetical protein